MRSHDNFDKDQHQYDIHRRIMERNFGNNSKNDGYQYSNINNENNLGEITGEFLIASEFDKGMPFRPKEHNNNKFYKEQQDPQINNPLLDFNLYDSKPNINVSYFDPLNSYKNSIGYSSVEYDIKILPTIELKSSEKILSQSINNFTFNFTKNFTNSIQTKKSLILSPFNIIQSFCLLYIGSKNNTENGLKNYFSLPNKKITYDSLYKLNNEITQSNLFNRLNLICIPKHINLNNAYLSYINKLGSFISFDPNNSKFETDKINNLISNSTNGMINNIMNPDILNKSMIKIICASYFHSVWQNPFSVANTKQMVFNGITKKTVMMMTQQSEIHRYFEDGKNQILEMDCSDGIFTMGFILPKSQYMDPIITHDQFEYYVQNLKDTYINILQIPKFKHNSNYKIDGLLKKFGLKNIFNSVDISDIAPMINNNSICVSEVIHTCMIIVNESDTKQSSNKNNMGKNNMNNTKINFIANHQFLYYIRYKPINTILFMGQYY